MAKLVVISSETDSREFLLGNDTVLGRSEDADISIQGPHISRRHARIILEEHGYFIEDLGSVNSTLVNGRAVQKARLSDGDWIEIGDHKLEFLLDEAQALPQAAPSETEAPEVVGTAELRETVTSQELIDPGIATKLKARMEAMQEVSEASCGALEIDKLARLILQQLLHVYPQADHAHALLVGLGEGQQDLRVSVARTGQESADSGMSRTVCEMASSQRKAVLAADVTGEPELQLAASIVSQSLRSIMCCPLVVGERMLGAIQVDTRNAALPFNEDDLRLLATIAGQVAVAAENARLHAEVVSRQRLAAVGEAVSNLAHCIKNVLNSLQGGSYIVDLGIKKNEREKVLEGWEMVKRNTGFMSDLAKDMLAYCRRSGLRRQLTDTFELLEETVLMVKESAAQKGIRVSVNAGGQSPVVLLDAVGLKRVVLNLLTNAVEACPEGCSVEVSAALEEQGTRLRTTVRDDGPGIPAEIKERLFQPFFTTKGSNGTGLGLALVSKVAEEHGGYVEAESEPGQGAAFHIVIPVERDEDETVMAPPSSST